MISLKKYFAHSLLLFCCTCVMTQGSQAEANKPNISKTYFVKGMTCGGCIFHVKHALEQDSKTINFSDTKVEVGKVTLIFSSRDYKVVVTDCLVTKSIEDKTGYKVFSDEKLAASGCLKK